MMPPPGPISVYAEPSIDRLVLDPLHPVASSCCEWVTRVWADHDGWHSAPARVTGRYLTVGGGAVLVGLR